MTASEFAFLALGLVLGVASGAALSIVIRARPPAPREVRVTVSTDAVPRRLPATLSAFAMPAAPSMAMAARGGPADPAVLGASVARTRTPVRIGAPRPLVGLPIRSDRRVAAISPASGFGDLARLALMDRWPVPVGAAPDGARAQLGGGAGAPGVRGGATSGGGTPVGAAGGQAGGSSGGVGSGGPGDGGGESGGGGGGPGDEGGDPGDEPGGPSDACADERRLADERCALAERLGEASQAAADRAREAQRAYDEHLGRSGRAAAVADPRAVRTAKEAAWASFRRTNAEAPSRDAVEGAARDWLMEIDRINRTAQEAEVEAAREREAASALIVQIEHLTQEAERSRINAESAASACVAARGALAACEAAERDRKIRKAPAAVEEVGAARPRLLTGPDFGPASRVVEEEAPVLVLGDREPAILKILRGDREAMSRVVGGLAGQDPAETRRWQLALSGLVDAILARAIEDTALEFPRDHPFWAPFSQEQCRDIATALASFGYRFDGLGGFSDGRVPGQRDLSLAVGYAGFDPMRIRHWPTEQETAELYREVAVSAGEFIAGAAGGLTLGEMVAVLRGRAEGLTDVWNAWGRIRPLLLEP